MFAITVSPPPSIESSFVDRGFKPIKFEKPKPQKESIEEMAAKTAMIRSNVLLSLPGSTLFRQASSLSFFLRPTAITTKQSLRVLSGSRSYSSSLHIENCGFRRLSPHKLELGCPRRFNTSTRATHVNDAGSIDSPLMQSMEKKIKEHLNAQSVSVKDASGDGRHVSIDVVSSTFEGQSAVNRQRMVYKAIWEELQSTVHAVDQMTTKTPSEAAAQK